MKDVLRYLETGELGRLASKPKDIGSTDVELEDDNIAVSSLMIEFTKFVSLSFHLVKFLYQLPYLSLCSEVCNKSIREKEEARFTYVVYLTYLII